MTKPTFIPVSVGEDGRERDADGHTKHWFVYYHSIMFSNRVHKLITDTTPVEYRETVEEFCDDVTDHTFYGGMAYIDEHLLSPTERVAMAKHTREIKIVPVAPPTNTNEPDNIPEFSWEFVEVCDAVLD